MQADFSKLPEHVGWELWRCSNQGMGYVMQINDKGMVCHGMGPTIQAAIDRAIAVPKQNYKPSWKNGLSAPSTAQQE